MTAQADLSLLILAGEDPHRLAVFYEAVTGWSRVVDTPVYVELRSAPGQRLGVYEASAYLRNLGAFPLLAPSAGGDAGLSRTEVYLGCDDVDEALTTALAAGGRLLAAASDKPWGDTVAYVEDPAGNVCALAATTE